MSMACEKYGGVKSTLHKFMVGYVHALELSGGQDDNRWLGFNHVMKPYNDLKTALDACGHNTFAIQVCIVEVKNAVKKLNEVSMAAVKRLEADGFEQPDKKRRGDDAERA